MDQPPKIQSDVDNLVDIMKTTFNRAAISAIEEATRMQYKSSLWYEMRYGRITASKAHEVSVCHTPDGSLVATIMGAKIPDTIAMKRGRSLELSVRKTVSTTLNKKIRTCGLYVCQDNPMLAASPDGLLKDATVEIKCPTKAKAKNNYLKNGIISEKCKAQVQLQMHATGIKIERAVAVDAGIRILPKTEDDYRRIVRLFREEDVPHHTFPLPSERNIHAVVRGIPAMFSEQEMKGELEQRGYTPLHIIRLKRSGGAPMPLVVVILPKIEKSQQLFNEQELLGLAIRVEVQKNSRLSQRSKETRPSTTNELDSTSDSVNSVSSKIQNTNQPQKKIICFQKYKAEWEQHENFKNWVQPSSRRSYFFHLQL
ncbi:unnamed protein product [Acanthoscelides obtectus]|uniref:YqaJ viral recombinase domain-containing protein n=1 Tax=Acanthoscelides obtectus TaxID=200917 RepID=A0A9P0PR90_ACAOB|nr:unnamed protein product [Acanthoscelides obtectus]CAK1681802.1 hypothetical protein AOBTE_LOCUS33283 [Acanthoscelides obtectus]